MHIAIPSRARLLAAFMLALVAVLSFPVSNILQAQSNASQQQNATEKPYVIEYYYKVKWGHADEFIALFKKNHYPVLKKEIEMGRILKVFAQAPRYHATKDRHSDSLTTILFTNSHTT